MAKETHHKSILVSGLSVTHICSKAQRAKVRLLIMSGLPGPPSAP
jgi:hypothetical protein